MQNSLIHDTGSRPDYTRGGIKEKGCDRPPVDSPISKSAALLEIFQHTTKSLPVPFPNAAEFPLAVTDWRIAARMMEILGVPIDPKDAWTNKPYTVLGKSVYEWIKVFEEIVGKESIEAKYIVGSAATYIAGQPLLREALDVFLHPIPDHLPEKQILRVKVAGKIAQKVFPFADVDIRIKVKAPYHLAKIQAIINGLEGCRTELFKNKTLIVYINEEQEKALDIVIYTELDNESAFNLDDFKVNITSSKFSKKLTVFESMNPWKWWFGQTLGVLENHSEDAFRIMPRLLWQLSKGKISILPTENTLFPLWLQKVQGKSPHHRETLKQQFQKQQKHHDRQLPLADCILRLRTQQLIKDHSPDSQFALREAANTQVGDTVPSFIRTLFHAMQEKGSDIPAIHSLIESVALLALYEAWQKPFEVKMVKHEGKWVMRLRFRGQYKRDLLVRFDIPASLKVLRGIKDATWEKMRVIVHSLWFDGMQQRDVENKYKRTLENRQIFGHSIDAAVINEIRGKLLCLAGPHKKDIIFAKQPPLAAVEIDWQQDGKILLEIGKIVFSHYHHDMAMRHHLCWKIVYKCIESHSFNQAAEMVEMLRKGNEDPVEGYISLFAHVILKGGNSFLYKAASPLPPVRDERWIELSNSKNKNAVLTSIMNEADVSAELFLELIRLLKIKNPEINENILCKIIQFDKKRAPGWIEKYDQSSFTSHEYNRLVSEQIHDGKGEFNAEWIKDYLLSRRYIGPPEHLDLLCKYLLTKPLKVADKAFLLEAFQIKESSLWQLIANEYLSQGEGWPESSSKEGNLDYASIVFWHQIIENGDNTAFVEETLKKIPPLKNNTKDVMRGLVLVRLLKNWKTKRVDIEILKKLDLSKKIPWEKVLHGATCGEQILKGLYKVSLPLYTSLFRALKPKDPYFTTYWVNMMLEAFPEEKNHDLLKALDTPLMIECLKIHEMISLPLLKRIVNFKDGIYFILEVLQEADQEIFYRMIQTCAAYDDGGELGAKVFIKFYNLKTHKKKGELSRELAILAKKIVMNPQGDLEAAGKMWRTIGELACPDRIPAAKNLLKLIRSGCADWAIKMLNRAEPQELESIDPEVYCALIRTEKELDKRCLILEGCHVSSAFIQKQWEVIAQSGGLDPFSALKLLNAAEQLRIPAAKVHHCALTVLSQCGNKNLVIEDRVMAYLVVIIPKLNEENGYQLWEALRKSNRIEKGVLWDSGFLILKSHPYTPNYNLMHWILQHSPQKHLDDLLTLLDNITDYPMEDRVKSIIHPFIKTAAIRENKSAVQIYWKMDCDEHISSANILSLRPSWDQCNRTLSRFIQKAKKEKISEPLMSSIWHLWIECSHFHLASNEDQTDEVCTLLANYIPPLSEVEKLENVRRGWEILSANLDKITSSKPYQQLCKVIIEEHKYLDEGMLYQIAELYEKHEVLSFDNIWKLLIRLSKSTNRTYGLCAIRGFEREKNFNYLTASIVYQARRYPEHIEIFQSLTDKINNLQKRHYLNGILIGIRFKITPSKKLALEFIEFLKILWNACDQTPWKEEKEDWEYSPGFSIESEDCPPEKISEHHPSALKSLFLIANDIIMRSSPRFMLEDEVLDIFIKNLEIYGEDEAKYQISMVRMFVRYLIDHFDERAADKLLNFIIKKISLFSLFVTTTNQVINNDKHIEFINGLILLTAKLISENIPQLNHWSESCSKCLCLINTNFYNTREVQNILLDSYVEYMVLTGDIFGFSKLDSPSTAQAIGRAVSNLCCSNHPENRLKARRILMTATPEILIYFNNVLRVCNSVFLNCCLKNMNDEELSQSLRELFSHLSDFELKTECFEISKERLKKFYVCYTDNRKKGAIVKIPDDREFGKKVKNLQLELIHHNIQTIIDSKPFLLPKMIDFLNNIFLSGLAKSYINYPSYFEDLLILLINACEKESRTSPEGSALSYRKLAIMISSHGFVSKTFINRFFPDVQLAIFIKQIENVKFYYSILEDALNDKKLLLELRPDKVIGQICENGYESVEGELTMRNQWCQMSYRVFEDIDLDTDGEAWLNDIQDELLRCFHLSGELHAWGSLTINILNLFGKVIQIIGKVSRKHPQKANAWLACFIHEMDRHLRGRNIQWYTMILAEKISVGMTLELLPCLRLLENFYKDFNPFNENKTCVEAYFNLVSEGCQEEHVIEKAIEHCDQLHHKVKLFIENNSNTLGYEGLCYEQSTDYSKKFEPIYLFELNRLLLLLADGGGAELFLPRWKKFRDYTDDTLCGLCENNSRLAMIILQRFNRYCHLLVDDRVFNEAADYLYLILSKIRPPSELDGIQYHMFYTLMLEFSIWMGPSNNQKESNPWLEQIRDKYNENTLLFERSLWKEKTEVQYVLKWCILDGGKPSLFVKMIRKMTSADAAFKQLFLETMDLMKVDFIRFKACRPQLADWYQSWINKIENLIILK